MDYSKMKIKQLKALCKERKIRGYSKLRKNVLIQILSSKEPVGPAKMRPTSPLMKKIQRLI